MEWGACPAATNILSLNRFLHRDMPRISASNNRSAAPKPTSDKSSHHMWDTWRTLVGCRETLSAADSASSVWERGGEGKGDVQELEKRTGGSRQREDKDFEIVISRVVAGRAGCVKVEETGAEVEKMRRTRY